MSVTINGNGTVTGVTSASGVVSAGTVAYFAASTAPTGWLVADGSAVSRTTYSDLFSAIGTTFGSGDGSTTFNVPNLGGQFIRSWASGQTTDSGRVLGSSQTDNFQTHQHNILYANAAPAGGGNIYVGTGSATPTQTANIVGSPSTGNSGTETRPKNVALLGCIKY